MDPSPAAAVADHRPSRPCPTRQSKKRSNQPEVKECRSARPPGRTVQRRGRPANSAGFAAHQDCSPSRRTNCPARPRSAVRQSDRSGPVPLRAQPTRAGCGPGRARHAVAPSKQLAVGPWLAHALAALLNLFVPPERPAAAALHPRVDEKPLQGPAQRFPSEDRHCQPCLRVFFTLPVRSPMRFDPCLPLPGARLTVVTACSASKQSNGPTHLDTIVIPQRERLPDPA